MEKAKLYVLQDPNTLEIRYIGITMKNLSERLNKHLIDVKNRSYKSPKKVKWIESIISQNKLPIISLIKEFDTIGYCEYYLDGELLGKVELYSDRDMKKGGIIDSVKFKVKNFFNGDLQKAIYCMKDVHLLHKWKVINRQFKPIDFGVILNKPTYKNISEFAAQACSGGACEITRI